MSAATVCSALVGSPPPFAIRPNVSRSFDKSMRAPPVAESPAVSKAFPSALNLGANCRITETSLVGSFAFTADWVWALKLLISLQNCAIAAAAGSAVGGGETDAVPCPHADSAIGRHRTSDVKSLDGPRLRTTRQFSAHQRGRIGRSLHLTLRACSRVSLCSCVATMNITAISPQRFSLENARRPAQPVERRYPGLSFARG
jgi:hypothetical protein